MSIRENPVVKAIEEEQKDMVNYESSTSRKPNLAPSSSIFLTQEPESNYRSTTSAMPRKLSKPPSPKVLDLK